MIKTKLKWLLDIVGLIEFIVFKYCNCAILIPHT